MTSTRAVVSAALAVAVVGLTAACGPTSPDLPAALLLRVDTVGGMCPDEEECASMLTVDQDGAWEHVAFDDTTRTGTLSPLALVELVEITDPERVRELTAAPPPVLCARDVDGPEVVVVARPGASDETRIYSCEHDLTGTALAEVVDGLWDEVSRDG